MSTKSQPEQQVYVLYTITVDGGIYDKHGPIIEQTENKIIFETHSETYRIVEGEYIERKQKNHWYKLGEIKNFHIRADEDPHPNR